MGLHRAGFQVVGFVENWSQALKSHEANFPEARLIGQSVNGDIRKIPDSEFRAFRGRVDLLFAGFPCQGFSHAGKKDPKDPRNRLFYEFVRATEAIAPRWVVGENVSGLVHRLTDDGKTHVSEVIIEEFESIGYHMADPMVLDSADYGVPQHRRRVFFVGSREKTGFSRPLPTHSRRGGPGTQRHVPIGPSVESTLEGAVDFDPSIVSGGVRAFRESDETEAPTGTPHPYLVAKLEAGLVSYGKRISPFHVEVADLDKPAKTIHSGYRFQPRLFVPLRNRRGCFLRAFTKRELAQLQGFPERYHFRGSSDDIIVQVGNAVPPALVTAVAHQIAACDGELGERLSLRSGLRTWEASAPIS